MSNLQIFQLYYKIQSLKRKLSYLNEVIAVNDIMATLDISTSKIEKQVLEEGNNEENVTIMPSFEIQTEKEEKEIQDAVSAIVTEVIGSSPEIYSPPAVKKPELLPFCR